MNLSIMSFNIRFGTARDGKDSWHIRRPLVVKTLLQHSCDIFGLQEALKFQLDEIITDLPNFDFIGVGRENGIHKGEHTAILYKKSKFDLIESSTFWFSETPEIAGSCHWGNRSPRICTWALLKEKGQKSYFYIYNVHLDHQSQYSRQKSCELLSDRICSRKYKAPVIITGDFNAVESNEIIKFLRGVRCMRSGKSNIFPLSDAYRAVHPKALGGTLHLFRGIRYGPRIDFIFADPHFKVLSSEIIRSHFNNKYPSDHFPLLALLHGSDYWIGNY